MIQYMVIGVGGTGSYLVNNLINYLGSSYRERVCLTLVDGDILEERNLLRQGFLKKDVNKNKAKALYDRYKDVIPEHISLEYRSKYIDSINDLNSVFKDKMDKYVVISCVDNNMARYRILMSQFYIFQKKCKSIYFIDAGNGEWHGQTLTTILKEGKEPPIVYEGGKFKYTGNVEGHHINTIFDSDSKWYLNLSRGEHEISCDEVTEASPQNIVANMTSSVGIMYMLNKLRNNDYRELRYQFNASTGVQELLPVESNEMRLKQFVRYANNKYKNDLIAEGEYLTHKQLEDKLDEYLELG